MKDDTSSAVQSENRRLAAIMFTDIVGFSRQMGSNETRTLRLLEVHNQVIMQAVAVHHGTVIKTVGDAFLVDFPSVVHAVQCAQQIQAQFKAHNADTAPPEQIHVRIGIHLGDIVQKDGDVFGEGVNIASRLQGLAEADTICISDVVYRDMAKKLELGTVMSLGRPKLKNIAERFAVYALLSAPPEGFRQTLRVQRLKLSCRVGTSQRIVMAILLLALVSVGAIVLRERYFSASPALPLPDKPSVAVLPFVNRSGDAAQEHFSDGMTDTLITDLSTVSGLFVIARNSAFTYKGKAVRVEALSKELGVRYVVEGSVQKTGDRVRINIQLIDATTGGHVWAERYDRVLQDIFALQDEISQKIVQALAVKLTQGEQTRLVRKETNNVEAYEAFWRGEDALWHRTQETNLQAQQLYERAIALDPQYAAAYAGLAHALGLAVEWGWDRDPQTLERAVELAQKALTLDASLPTAHHVLGGSYWFKG
jgi:adenylate cyclase